MKNTYETTSQARFPYCQRHNRLFAHYTVGWLTPARPEDLNTFQALCDECRKEIACISARNSPNKTVRVATAS